MGWGQGGFSPFEGLGREGGGVSIHFTGEKNGDIVAVRVKYVGNDFEVDQETI